MNYIRSIVTWIDSLESGSHFQKWISILVNALGILALISAIVWGIAICVGSIATSDFLGIGGRTLVVIGSILSLCIYVVVGFVLIMLFRNRLKKIGTLRDETHFALLPITVILIRLCGEFSFIFSVATGIQILLASIFGSGIPDLEIILSDLTMPGNVSFIFGVISLVVSVFAGAVVLIIHYFIAELINLFVDIATNLRKIQTTLSTEEIPQR